MRKYEENRQKDGGGGVGKPKQRGKTDPGIERHREKTLRNKEREKEVEGKERCGGEERKRNMLWERRMEE